MAKVTVRPFRPVYPTPAALISCSAPGKEPNIITLGEVFNIGLEDPAIIGIAIRKARYSHGLISESRQFVVNLPTVDLVEQTDWCGTHSGRKLDKFRETGLTPVASTRVAAPLIEECPVNIECVVTSIQEVGDHDLFLGEVVATHVDESVLDSAGRLDPERLRSFCFMLNLGCRGEYRQIGDKIADAWFTAKR